jgi:hypothetical protein
VFLCHCAIKKLLGIPLPIKRICTPELFCEACYCSDGSKLNLGQSSTRVATLARVGSPILIDSRALSSTLIDFELVQILMRVDKSFCYRAVTSNQLSSTLMQLLFSFDQGMRVEKTLVQTLASQLSSTLMQLLFSFDRGMRVEKTLVQTLASQLSSTLMQLLFSFDQGMRVEKTLVQTIASQLSASTLI